jgi:hypothetical protein
MSAQNTTDTVVSADELEHDPRAFEPSMTPAVVCEVCDDGDDPKVSFADVELRESGALYWEEWTGESGLLPEWRWSQVTYLDVEENGCFDVEDASAERPPGTVRIVEKDWRRLPARVREVIGR